MSNTSAFKGKKIAVMVASGFNEEQFLIIQKTILAAEGSYTLEISVRLMVGHLRNGDYLILLTNQSQKPWP